MTGKRALVTGACGFVGSHMVELLLSRGYSVVATDKKLDGVSNASNVEFRVSDVTDIETLRPLFGGIDLVFHIAGLFDYWAPYERLHKVNVGGTRNLCEVALDYDIESLVVWSSGSVYGMPGEIPVRETTPPKPLNNYEKSKAEEEQAAREFYEQNGLPVTILRPASIYGPRSKYGTSVLLFLLARGQLPAIPGDGRSRPATVHVRDVVGAAEYLADKGTAIGESFNVADDSRYSVEELLLAVTQMLGVRIYKFHIPISVLNLVAQLSEWQARLKGTRPRVEKESIRYLTYDSLIDNSKIKAAGYELLYPDPVTGLGETIEWYKREGWL